MRSPPGGHRELPDPGIQPSVQGPWRTLADLALASVAIPAALRVVAGAAARLPGSIEPSRALLEAISLLVIGLSIPGQWRNVRLAVFPKLHPLVLVTGLSFFAGAGLALVGDSQLTMGARAYTNVWLLAAAEEVVFRRLLPRYFACKLAGQDISRSVAVSVAFLLAQGVFAFSHPIAAETGVSRWTSWLLLFDAGLFLSVVACRSLPSAIALHSAVNAELSFGNQWRSRPGFRVAVACCGVGIWLVMRLSRRSVPVSDGDPLQDRAEARDDVGGHGFA